MEKVLITGANGYIGSNLVSALQKEGSFELHLAARARIVSPHKSYVFDITDFAALERVVNSVKPEIVVHLAATGFNYAKKEAFEELVNVNFTSTCKLARMCQALPGFQKFVYLTTYMECQGSKNAIASDGPLAPQSEYALSKSFSTSLLECLSRKGELNANVLRIFSVYGSGDRKFRFIPSLFEALQNNRVVETTSLKQKRDFVLIDDVVQAIICSMKKGKTPRTTYNIGHGKATALLDVALKIQELYPKSKGEIRIGAKPDRQGEAPVYFADISKTKSDLGWAPECGIDEGLGKVRDSYPILCKSA